MERKENCEERVIGFDILRIIACFSVIVLHVSAQYWYHFPVTDSRWVVCNAYDAAFRFGVPIFVMISGALFLGVKKEISIKKLLYRNVLRLVFVYFLWSLFYALWFLRETPNVDFRMFFAVVIESKYHLWFLPMLMQLYLLVPLFYVAARFGGEKLLRYILCLFVLFKVIPFTADGFALSGVGEKLLTFVNMEMIGNYAGYFLLGYYLYKYPPSKGLRKIIYLFGILGILGAIICSTYMSRRHGVAESTFFDSFSLFTFFISNALYLFILSFRFNIKEGTRKRIQNLSKDTFGVYLIHLGIIEYMFTLGIDSELFPNILSIPTLSICWFILSVLVISIVRRIPYLGKYIC